MPQEHEDVANILGCSYEAVSVSGSYIWQFRRKYGDDVRMSVEVHAGLHIESGFADIRKYSKGIGGFQTDQPILVAYIAPGGGAVFDTQVHAGAGQSFGVHIDDLDAAEGDPCLTTIVKAVRGKPMAIVGGGAARRTTKLQLAIEPWFQADTRDMVLQSRAMELIAIVAESLGQPDRQSIRSTDVVRAHAVMEQIEQDLGRSLRLEDLARQSAIEVRLMTAAFRRVFGESIGEYITRRRMQEAVGLISKGASIKATASQLGYSPNAFSTAFRKYYGYPPSRF